MYKNLIKDFIQVNEDSVNRIKKIFDSLLNSKRTIKEEDFFLACLKKWNSASPKYPLNQSILFRDYLKYDYTCGGGYFLVIGGYGLIVDPGYKFLEIFYENGFVPHDIDGIFISHSHDDHCIDLEAIFSVIFKSNKDKNDKEKRKIDLFINSTSFQKYSPMFLNDYDMVANLKILDKEEEIFFGEKSDIKLNPLNTKHNEMPWQNSSNFGRGFCIEYNMKKIVYSSDTKYFKELELLDVESYDVLILNLGKLGKTTAIETKKHLGLEGIRSIISKCFESSWIRNSVIIISEMGFELKDIRFKIIRKLREFIENYAKQADNIDEYSIKLKILYAEPGVIIDLKDNKMITRLEIKLREPDEFNNIINEIESNVEPLLGCAVIKHNSFKLYDGKRLDIGFIDQWIEENKVFLPDKQILRNKEGFKRIEKIIFTRLDRINKIDSVKFGRSNRKAFIKFLERKYNFTNDVYLTLFEFELIKD